ncbi:phosphotransferase [Streptomyces griseorubiginosus]|uniref:phosphotransferase n=1 Tax=Streptomyces griseorubiginosus TaxID=67304 RepID=UPI0011403CE6|nr:phosphotransferase [Streptomyces griseorubiginosus]
MEETALGGGAVNEVVRIGDTVRRRASQRTGFVRELLTLFERADWPGAPRFLGVDEQGREMFGYIEGRAALTPHERTAASTDEALVEVARLVRAFHDLTHGTALAGDQDVVCHNDLAPKNTVHTAWRPVAFIDWDLAAPGERVHDLAHVCWQYLDLGPGVTDVRDAARRIRLICDAYGLDERGGLLDTVRWWQDRCRRGIEAGALRGEPAMVRLRASGVVDEVRAAQEWVARHRRELGAFLD